MTHGGRGTGNALEAKPHAMIGGRRGPRKSTYIAGKSVMLASAQILNCCLLWVRILVYKESSYMFAFGLAY